MRTDPISDVVSWGVRIGNGRWDYETREEAKADNHFGKLVRIVHKKHHKQIGWVIKATHPDLPGRVDYFSKFDSNADPYNTIGYSSELNDAVLFVVSEDRTWAFADYLDTDPDGDPNWEHDVIPVYED